MSSPRSAHLVDDDQAVLRLAVIPPPASDRSPFLDGFEQGRVKGRAEAIEELARAHEAATESLSRAATALRGAVVELNRRREQEVRLAVVDSATIVLSMAEVLVGKVSEHPEWWVPARIEAAMALLPDDAAPVVHLCPDDLEALSSVELPSEVRLVNDLDIAPGGCVVDAGPTRIDAGLDSALARLRTLLSGERA